ncbi:transketolase 1-related [Anaeramoeba flamelloides]|uniref:transketolase n=1 Tax=Anaeramoeba flamelloides TaxID=1746091 RepID=A0AAV8A0R5_9EUKA|nr:transketolase 1-related [Anaeramoeba flamelloides]
MELIDKTSINALRVLANDMITKARSGHPGAPLGCSPMAHVLFTRHLNVNPKNPNWISRDRFILSNGHASAMLYSFLHASGYDLSIEDLKQFRQIGSKTPGHPENLETDGVEITTGPLGQGVSSAVGFALAEANLGARFNKDGLNIFDNFVYVIMGDGCAMEGVSNETASIAGHLGLGKLIVLYDDNDITIEGGTNLSFTESVPKRYEALGWHVQIVQDGDNDLESIDKAIQLAKETTDKPSLIAVKTTIGFGTELSGTCKIHGSPLNDENLKKLKKVFGFDPEKYFELPEEVYKYYKENVLLRGQKKNNEWEEMMVQYEKKHPELFEQLTRMFKKELPKDWQQYLPVYEPTTKMTATRRLSGVVLNSLSKNLPELLGGSADCAPSNCTLINKGGDLLKGSYQNMNVRFGIREHGMAAICNGLAAYGVHVPYCATFLTFIGYALGAVRVSALSGLRILYIMTHDSVALGEDGPTHQPIETFSTLRGIPNLNLIRPCDGNEVSGAYSVAIESKNRPSVLCLTRQGVPNLEGTSIEGVSKGAYQIYPLKETENVQYKLNFIATGSEVPLCLEAAKILSEKKNIQTKVISFPCWELFEEQSTEYKTKVLGTSIPTISVETGSSLGWKKYSHYSISIDEFGKSGKASEILKHFGFTVENLLEKGEKIVKHYSNKQVPNLLEQFEF